MFPAHQLRLIPLRFKSLHEVVQVLFQVLAVGFPCHSIYAHRRIASEFEVTESQVVLAEP